MDSETHSASDSDPDQTSYVDTLRAADMLGISARTLQRMRLTGDGPQYAKAGRRVLYRKDWLEQWLLSRSFRSTAEAKAKGIR